MFDVGEKVVCVDDRWADFMADRFVCPFTRGQVYTVTKIAACEPSRSDIDGSQMDGCLAVIVAEVRYVGKHATDARRFRKLRDISQSLSELKELALNCPALAVAGAAG